jgi:hypothetical protein
MSPRTHPLVEVFGYPTDNFSDEANRHRTKKLCPFNNKVPNCTKDKASDPLGTCCVGAGDGIAITCPIRFRQDWIIADHGAEFFFPEKAKWTSLTEVRLKHKSGKSAGNIDLVLVSYDDRGKVTDFGALEIQGVYISGNVRKPFEYYMQDPKNRAAMNWKNQDYWPGPDYLSSSRKRLAPPWPLEGGTLRAWRKRKTAVAVDSRFFATLPTLREVPREKADAAWLVYDLRLRQTDNRYVLERQRTVYTELEFSSEDAAESKVDDADDLIDCLQERLDMELGGGTAPDMQTIDELF